jgi:RNA polymerase primary sigma factor
MRQLKISNSITNRESPSLQKYLQEISKVEMLSPDEEVELAIRIKKGDKIALDRLTKANLRFVVSVAKQYQGHGLSLSDLVNEGNLGLIKAAQRFDVTRGFKFISFAVWWIRQNILQALAENARTIRLPMNKVALANRIQKASSALEQQLERAPSEEELADAMNINLEDVTDGIRHNGRQVSLDTPFSDEEDGSLLNTLENPNAEKTDSALYYSESLRLEIDRSLQVLNPKQRATLCYLFGIGMDHALTMEDVAQKFDLTLERVRQIKEKAIQKLRGSQNFDALRSYLGR